MSAAERSDNVAPFDAYAQQIAGIALTGELDGSPLSLAALTRAGFVHYAAGAHERAVTLFTAATKISANQPLTWNNLALALGALGQLENAVDALRQSLALQSVQPEIWVSLANNLLQLDRFDSAEIAVRAAIAIDDSAPSAWQILALTRTRREDFTGAAEAFARVLALKGEDPALRANLGVVLFRAGRFAEASENLQKAVALTSSSEIRQTALLACLAAAALIGPLPLSLRDECFAKGYGAGDADSGPDRLFKTALLTLDQFGHRAAAVHIADAWIARRPSHAEAAHLRDALLGKAVDRAPAASVEQQFDASADRFDDQLVNCLKYDGPAQIAFLLNRHVAVAGALDILDIGCGTGLCAPHLKPYARHLAGVDLSSRMISKARARRVYDTLEVGELLTTLDRAFRHWDVIAGADVLSYFGALESVFDRVAAALKPGGYFVFSVEASDEDRFVLLGSGRYAHSYDYIETLCEGRFVIVDSHSSMLRKEGGDPVDGYFFLLQKW